ncbi:hypothetical protein [Microbacterium sp. BR1]|uniref:hypothetical protein n=1 Tax=Microbacterium sp. BR1 TaxID=1070896 RepID=UPI000C2C8803|nr:hypothetical protein [Microbacterium sp. BR1]
MSALGQELTPVVLQHAGVGTDGDQFADSTASADVAMLDALPKDQQELALTMMLDQSKQWLERALEATNPAREVSDIKAFFATVAEAAKQKKLSEGIQLEATEMVRRAERGLGVAIRKGQDAGEIAKRGQGGSIPPGATSRHDRDVALTTDFAHKDELTDIYAMTDDVSDEQFEDVMGEAKEEGNLSRSNVTRKLKALPTHSEAQAAKWQTVADLATQRLTSPQIAQRVGMTEKHVRAEGARRGIEFPADKVMGKTKRINGLDVMERLVTSIEVNQSALELVEFEDISPEKADEWLQRLAEPLRAINRMKSRLKEISNG